MKVPQCKSNYSTAKPSTPSYWERQAPFTAATQGTHPEPHGKIELCHLGYVLCAIKCATGMSRPIVGSDESCDRAAG